MQITAHLDFDTPPASKQLGCFFVAELRNEKGEQLTHLAKGILFHSVGQLTRHINNTASSPISKVLVLTPVLEEKGDF